MLRVRSIDRCAIWRWNDSRWLPNPLYLGPLNTSCLGYCSSLFANYDWLLQRERGIQSANSQVWSGRSSFSFPISLDSTYDCQLLFPIYGWQDLLVQHSQYVEYLQFWTANWHRWSQVVLWKNGKTNCRQCHSSIHSPSVNHPIGPWRIRLYGRQRRWTTLARQQTSWDWRRNCMSMDSVLHGLERGSWKEHDQRSCSTPLQTLIYASCCLICERTKRQKTRFKTFSSVDLWNELVSITEIMFVTTETSAHPGHFP